MQVADSQEQSQENDDSSMFNNEFKNPSPKAGDFEAGLNELNQTPLLNTEEMDENKTHDKNENDKKDDSKENVEKDKEKENQTTVNDTNEKNEKNDINEVKESKESKENKDKLEEIDETASKKVEFSGGQLIPSIGSPVC